MRDDQPVCEVCGRTGRDVIVRKRLILCDDHVDVENRTFEDVKSALAQLYADCHITWEAFDRLYSMLEDLEDDCE